MFYFNYPAVALTNLGSIAPSGAVERQRFPLWVVVWFYYSGPKLTVLKKCLTYLWIVVGCCLVLFFKPKMNCVKMSDVSVDFHCIESRQWFEVLHSWQYEEFYDFTNCSESCQSVAVLVLTMRQQVREVHSFSQSPAAGCKHQQHNSSLLHSQCCHCFKSDC